MRLPSASLLFDSTCGENLRGEQHARRDHQLRIGNLISTRSLSSGTQRSKTMKAPPAPYFKFPTSRLLLIWLFQLTASSGAIRSSLAPTSGTLLNQPDKHEPTNQASGMQNAILGIESRLISTLVL